MTGKEVLHEVRKSLDLAYPEQVSATAFPGATEMQWCSSCNIGQKDSEEFTPNSSECHKRDCQLQEDLNLFWIVRIDVISVSSLW